MAYYHYNDFKEACCKNENSVIPINTVLQNAEKDFNLSPRSGLLSFICNDGLEDIQFVNTKDWENNPRPKSPIKVDGYKFRSRSKSGYIAFMFNTITNKWILKSFHLSKDRDCTMISAFERLGNISKLQLGGEND